MMIDSCPMSGMMLKMMNGISEYAIILNVFAMPRAPNSMARGWTISVIMKGIRMLMTKVNMMFCTMNSGKRSGISDTVKNRSSIVKLSA